MPSPLQGNEIPLLFYELVALHYTLWKMAANNDHEAWAGFTESHALGVDTVGALR
jgi:hypothetical protein